MVAKRKQQGTAKEEAKELEARLRRELACRTRTDVRTVRRWERGGNVQLRTKIALDAAAKRLGVYDRVKKSWPAEAEQ